jgi:putative transposase
MFSTSPESFKKKTKSAKRRLRERRQKESLFAKDINHQISKQIVKKAKRTNRAIALKELKGIRSRVRARKAKRSELHSWSFGQLRDFIEYKAKLAGGPVITVKPCNKSTLTALQVVIRDKAAPVHF